MEKRDLALEWPGGSVEPAGNILSVYEMKWLSNNDVHARGFVIKLEFDSSVVCL
jgi:hypothetical protein